MVNRGQPGIVVWINGFPGVGKMTVAAELAKLLGDNGDTAIIINAQDRRKFVTVPPTHADFDKQFSERRAAALLKHVFPEENFSKPVIIVGESRCLRHPTISWQPLPQRRNAFERGLGVADAEKTELSTTSPGGG